MFLLLVAVLTTAHAHPGRYIESLSAEGGAYDNRIPRYAPAVDYVEVCWSGGVVVADVHAAGESPAGGLCEVGQRGVLLTSETWEEATWKEARGFCVSHGMRLPSLTEIAVTSALDPEVLDWPGNHWASNLPTVTGSSVYAITEGGSAYNITSTADYRCAL